MRELIRQLAMALHHAEGRLNEIPHNYADTDFKMLREAGLKAWPYYDKQKGDRVWNPLDNGMTYYDKEGKEAIFPKLVCLCGSTKFFKEFQEANYRETMAGNIVLSVGFYPHSQEEAHGARLGCSDVQKVMLDELHKRKIDLSDEILVIDKDDYIGASTASEIAYAEKNCVPVRYMSNEEWADV